MALPSQEIQALAQAAEEERKRQEEAAKQMSAGLGLTGAAFAAQTNRAPTTPPAGPPSELAQRIAAQDAANRNAARQAARQRASDSRFKIQGGGTATGKLNPALGSRGGSTLPSQPSLNEASRAAAGSATSASGTSGASAGRSILDKGKDVYSSAKNTGLARGAGAVLTRASPVMTAVGVKDTGLQVAQGLDYLSGKSNQLFGGGDVRLSDRNPLSDFVEFMMERTYGTGLDKDGNPTGKAFENKQRSLIGDLGELGTRLANVGVKSYDATARGLDAVGKAVSDYVMGGFQNPEGNLPKAQTMEFRDVNNNGIEDREEGLNQPAQETPEAPVTQEAPATLEVPKTNPEDFEPIADPPTKLELLNREFKNFQNDGGTLNAADIRRYKQEGAKEGLGFNPEAGFFNRDFEGQEFEGQTIGEYLSVGFQTPKDAVIAGGDTDPQKAKDENLVRTLDPNTGEMIFANQETANAIADFYARQRRGEALTRQEALESGAMRDFSNRQLNNVINSEFSQASRDREERIRNRPDFFEPVRSNADVGAKKYGGYTTAELRDLVGGDRKALRRAKVLAAKGKDPLTGKDIDDPNEMTAYQKEALKLQQDRLDFAKDQAGKEGDMTEYQKKTLNLAERKFAQAQKEFDAAQKALSAGTDTNEAKLDKINLLQKRLNLAESYRNFAIAIGELDEVPEDLNLDASDFEADLDAIEENFGIELDQKTMTFYKGKKRDTVMPDSRDGRLLSQFPSMKFILNNYPTLEQ